MIHYSCDRCRRTIHEEELRFSVSIEIQVAIDYDERTLEEIDDPLGELNEILQHFDEDEREEISQFAYQQRHFDLCADCHREYLKNPLAVDLSAKVEFSEN